VIIFHGKYVTNYSERHIIWNISYAKNVGRPDGEGGRDKDDDILVSFTSFGTDESFTWETQISLYSTALSPQWYMLK
jgi:hypothetical protein